MTDTKHTFGCDDCGGPVTAYPPDDIYRIISVENNENEDRVEVSVKCLCGKSNTRYWYK